jgi:hypothetical protein
MKPLFYRVFLIRFILAVQDQIEFNVPQFLMDLTKLFFYINIYKSYTLIVSLLEIIKDDGS